MQAQSFGEGVITIEVEGSKWDFLSCSCQDPALSKRNRRGAYEEEEEERKDALFLSIHFSSKMLYRRKPASPALLTIQSVFSYPSQASL